MFDEYSCGCIVSMQQGRIRICAVHRLAKATGDGGLKATWTLRNVVRRYPANGEK